MKKLTQKIIEKYEKNFDKVKWNELIDTYNVPELFIEKFKDRLDWSQIAWRQVLSESFIKKYKDKLDWIGEYLGTKLFQNHLLKNLKIK